jgi:hypothetical protein|tara:strand:+ start:1606 stop:1725 length:120 start_codon:yes stop_codon:yes gene_type:complete
MLRLRKYYKNYEKKVELSVYVRHLVMSKLILDEDLLLEA